MKKTDQPTNRPTDQPTLPQLLAPLPYHLIAIIGRNTGLGLDANLKKTALIEKVAAWLLAAETAPRLHASLDPPLRRLLADLQLAAAPVPIRLLTRRYGPLRSPRQLIRAYRQQEPLSPLDQLCLSGLLWPHPSQTELLIPAELAARLPVPPPPPTRSLPPSSDLAPVSRLCHDLAALLALLQRDAPRLLQHRWLPRFPAGEAPPGQPG